MKLQYTQKCNKDLAAHQQNILIMYHTSKASENKQYQRCSGPIRAFRDAQTQHKSRSESRIYHLLLFYVRFKTRCIHILTHHPIENVHRASMAWRSKWERQANKEALARSLCRLHKCLSPDSFSLIDHGPSGI